jgi:hypothetical protein
VVPAEIRVPAEIGASSKLKSLTTLAVWFGRVLQGSLRLLFLCLVTLVIVCSGCGGLLERGVFVAGLGSGGVHLIVVG